MTDVKFRRTRLINAQRGVGDCGPIAIANLIKWCGIRTTYREVRSFCIGTRTMIPGIGMLQEQMWGLLKTLKVRFRKYRKFGLKDIDRAIAEGSSIVLMYETRRFGGHAVFIDATSKKRIRVWNRTQGHFPWYSRRDVSDDLRRSVRRGTGHPHVYVFPASNKRQFTSST